MILDSIKLANIRSHRDTSIVFPKGGITLFRGDVGSGKSTILMGIEFALFGTGPASKSDSLLSLSAESGEVMLAFRVGETQYEVGRSLKRSRGQKITQDSKNAYLKVDGVLEPVSTSQLKVRILDALGLNEPSSAHAKSRIYRYAIFTPQDKMKDILWDSEKRLETIRKVFRMEDYHTAGKNTVILKGKLRESIVRFEERFRNLDTLRSDYTDAKKRAQSLVDTVGAHSAEAKKLEDQESDAKAEVAKYEKRIAEKSEIDSRAASIKSKMAGEAQLCQKYDSEIIDGRARIDEITGQIHELKAAKDGGAVLPPTAKSVVQLDEEIARFAHLNDQLVAARTEAVSIKRQADALDARLSAYGARNVKALEDAAAKDETICDTLQGEIDALESEHESANDNRIGASKEIERLADGIKGLQGLGAKCRLCGQTLTEAHLQQQGDEWREMLEHARTEHKRFDDMCGQLSARINEKKAERDELRQKADSARNLIPAARDYEHASSEIDRLQADVRRLDAQNVIPEEPGFSRADAAAAIASSSGTRGTSAPVVYLSALKDALMRHEESARRADSLKEESERQNQIIARSQADRAKSEERVREFEAQIAQISEQLELYAKDGDLLDRAKTTLDEIARLLGAARENLAGSRASLDNETRNITRLASDIRDAERWQAEHARYTAYKRWLEDFFEPNVSQIEKSVLISTQDLFNTAYKEWYARLVDDPTKDSRINEDFAPVVEQDGFVQNVEYLSGGEKTSVALAYRLALNSVMKKQAPNIQSNLLILDEPTDGLSRSQLAHVRGILRTLDSEQIILVSHEQELEVHADHVFEVEKSSGGVTSVSITKRGI